MQTSFSGESTYPQVIRDFLESEPLYENGSMPADETKVATFKTYVAANWISMLDTFELEQPSLNNKYLIVSATEYLAGETYFLVLGKICELKENNKNSKPFFEGSILSIGPGKAGFLSYNDDNPQVKVIAARANALCPPSSQIKSILGAIMAGDALEYAESATLAAGLPLPEKLPPPE